MAFALEEAILKADAIKANGTHMYVIGIGNGVDENNLIAISGSDKDVGPGSAPDIFEADYTLVPLEDLQECLESIPPADMWDGNGPE